LNGDGVANVPEGCAEWTETTVVRKAPLRKFRLKLDNGFLSIEEHEHGTCWVYSDVANTSTGMFLDSTLEAAFIDGPKAILAKLESAAAVIRSLVE